MNSFQKFLEEEYKKQNEGLKLKADWAELKIKINPNNATLIVFPPDQSCFVLHSAVPGWFGFSYKKDRTNEIKFFQTHEPILKMI